MKKLRIGLIIVSTVVFIADLTLIDYNNLAWDKNTGPYLGLISMSLLIIANIGSIIYDKKRQTEISWDAENRIE